MLNDPRRGNAAQAEHGDEVPASRREPSKGADRPWVEADRDDRGRHAGEDRDRREQRIEPHDLVTVGRPDREAALLQQDDPRDRQADRGHLEHDAAW